MMKFIKKAAIFLVPFVLPAVALFISIAPDIINVKKTPSDRVFPMIHNHITDYYYYLSLMEQGKEGKWLITSRMTPENLQSAFAQTFFAVLGQLSRIFEVPLYDTYFVARIAFGIALMLAVIYTVKKIFPENRDRILACALVFFGSGFWTVSISNWKISVNQFLSFWTRLDPVMRTTFLPHHIASTFLGLLSVVYLAESLEKNDMKKSITAGILGFLSGFIYFATMVNVIGGLVIGIFIAGVIYVLSTYIFSVSHYKSRVKILSIYFTGSMLALFYIFLLSVYGGFPWVSYNNVGEHFIFGATLPEYILMLGPTFLLTLIGTKNIVMGSRILPKLLLGWAVFPFLGLFILSRIYWKFGDVYYLEAGSYIPLGILSIYGWKILAGKLKAKHRLAAPAVLAALFLYFVPPTVSSVNKQVETYTPYYYNQYIPREVVAGIDWLDNMTPSQSVVLAGGYFGAIIPAFSHNRVVYGHPSGTYLSGYKIADVNTFFAQKDAQAAREILRKYNVSYIFYSMDTDQPKAEFIGDLPLRKVLENNYVRIYKVER